MGKNIYFLFPDDGGDIFGHEPGRGGKVKRMVIKEDGDK